MPRHPSRPSSSLVGASWPCPPSRRARRYSYRNQPEAAQFNLIMLANALLAAQLVPMAGAEEVLGEFSLVSAVGGMGTAGGGVGVKVCGVLWRGPGPGVGRERWRADQAIK